MRLKMEIESLPQPIDTLQRTINAKKIELQALKRETDKATIERAAAMEEEDKWDESDYQVVDIVGESGKTKRYEKIPRKLEGDVYDYNLRELDRADRGAGGLFVVLGMGVVAGSYLKGWIDGIKTIERKRNAVRYRYGKELDFSFQIQPTIDMKKEKFGGQLCLRF